MPASKPNTNLDQLKELTESLIDRDFLLKRRQYMFDKLLESSPVHVLVWVIDSKFEFIHAGGSIPSIGICDSEQYIGSTLFDFLKTDNRELSPIREIEECLHSGNEISFKSVAKGRVLFTKCSPLKNYSDEVVGVVGVSWDVSDLELLKDIFEDLIENENELSPAINKKIRNFKSSIEKICRFK